MKTEKKIRVAVILPSFSIGGTENMVANLVKYIDKQKFEVLVISLFYPMETHVQRMIEEAGVKIVYGMRGKLPVWRVAIRVNRALAAFHPALLHSNMYAYAFVVPYLLTHPILLLHTVHNKPVREFKEKYKKLIGFLYRRNKAVPVAISHIVERELKELYPYLKRVERVYNPVETERFWTERKENERQDICLIHVARMMKQKNQELLLRAFAAASRTVPSIQLLLVGDGELRESLETLADDLGIRQAVEFAGNVSNVEQYLARADVFILSSDYEGLPLSALEAMASGLPVISTEVGGMADIVTDNGILVKQGDEQGLTEAILELARNAGERYRMGQNSLRNSKAFDSRRFIEKYEKLYFKYANGRNH